MPKEIASPPYVRELARLLRKNMTPTELLLWDHVRDKRLHGIRFKRQEPMGRYIVDFIALRPKIVIEIDGGIHDATKDYDGLRDNWLRSLGYTTLRVTTHQLTQHLDKVLLSILKACTQAAVEDTPKQPPSGSREASGPAEWG